MSTARSGGMQDDSMAGRFADALIRGEREGSADVIVALFADDAELRSLTHDAPLHGIAGARKFWQDYLASFRSVQSCFEKISDSDGLAVLEWVTEATVQTGETITYRGVSILEHDGTHVRRFRTYFDPRPLAGRAHPRGHAHAAAAT